MYYFEEVDMIKFSLINEYVEIYTCMIIYYVYRDYNNELRKWMPQ